MGISIVMQELTLNAVKQEQNSVQVRELSHRFNDGECAAIVTDAEAKTSPLLYVLAGFTKPCSGKVLYFQEQGQDKRRRLFSDAVKEQSSFLFPELHLLDALTPLQNVAFPLYLRGELHAEDKVFNWLEMVGLQDKANVSLCSLSKTEKCFLALARAFVTEPKIVLAEQFIWQLDKPDRAKVLECFLSFCQQLKVTCVFTTIEEESAKYADRGYRFQREKLEALA